MNGIPLSRQEIEQIREMKGNGMTNPEIAQVLHRSVRTIHRISYQFLYPKEKADPVVISLLKKWGNWDIPKKKAPKPHSWFITPYNYPRMWKSEE